MEGSRYRTRRKALASVALAFGVAVSSFQPASAQYLGVTTGYNYDNELTGPPKDPNSTNVSLYNPDPHNPDKTWNSWVEQYNQAGIDFVAVNLRGSQPVTSYSPTHIVPLVTAITNQGLTDSLKLAIFDDNGTSWIAQRNLASGNGFGYGTDPVADSFDMSNEANWKYIYDYNYKLFYETVPDANRFKINGRPVIIIWTGSSFRISNEQGNYSRAMNYVRQRCQADFGFDPYIIVAGSALGNDSTLAAPGVIDGVQSWFSPNKFYSLANFSGNGTSTGVFVAQFHHPGDPSYIDPNHGARLDTSLAATIGSGALLTLGEGFTDDIEEAALFRVRNIDPNGNALDYAHTQYDYPNQRLSILRAHSQNPFPQSQKFEAEGADFFGGAAGGNGLVNYYRNGNIAIGDAQDTGGGHYVGWVQPGEWLEWEHVPLNGAPHFVVRAASIQSAQVQLVIDGVAQPVQTMPSTGGLQNWTNFDLGAAGTFTQSYHSVRLVFPNGGLNVNWWRTEGGTAVKGPIFQTISTDAWYNIVNKNSGSCVDASAAGTSNGTVVQQWPCGSQKANQEWQLQPQGSGVYSIVNRNAPAEVWDVKNRGTSDGSLLQLWTYVGATNQQWMPVPLGDGTYKFVDAGSGRCLDVPGASTANGVQLQIFDCNGTASQSFQLSPQP
jgi:hypothetical protein